jgi:hypothetical protein
MVKGVMSLRRVLLVLAIVCALPAAAQESDNYRLTEHTFNAGGHPADGVSLTSASYRVSLDAIGDSVTARWLGGASYQMDGGFVSAYPPPGEVNDLLFADAATLVWSPDGSGGHYNLYRALMSTLPGSEYGSCEQPGLAGETAFDADVPPASDCYFYLVTAENRLHEEGTKGWSSSGAERSNPSPCP